MAGYARLLNTPEATLWDLGISSGEPGGAKPLDPMTEILVPLIPGAFILFVLIKGLREDLDSLKSLQESKLKLSIKLTALKAQRDNLNDQI